MGFRIKKRTSPKQIGRLKRHRRVRSRVYGMSERPRLMVFRSQQHIYAQVIDDVKGCVLFQSSTLDKNVKLKKGNTIAAAATVGAEIAKKAIAKKLKKVVFDTGGFKFHGRVKALAEAARKGGLVF